MNIAVYLPVSDENSACNFIVETFFPLFKRLNEHRFFIISGETERFYSLSGFDLMTIKPKPRNPLLRKIWIERTLMGLLKKIRADIFISADNFCSLKSSLFQGIVVSSQQQLKERYARKARLLLVMSETSKNDLTKKFGLDDDKIAVIDPFPDGMYEVADTTSQESVKSRYSGGKEYFLFNGYFQRPEDLIDLLKSFSYFKKRQQSNFRLLILSGNDLSFEKIIGNYKYRNDITIISTQNIRQKAAITAEAYAVVLPFDLERNLKVAVNTLQANVPVIATTQSALRDLTTDAILYADKNIMDMAGKMMQLYKDENLRSQLVYKGKDLVKNLTEERSADQLRKAFMRAMN